MFVGCYFLLDGFGNLLQVVGDGVGWVSLLFDGFNRLITRFFNHFLHLF